MWCATAATYFAVPGTASHFGASVERIASAVVSSAITLAYGVFAASSLPSACTTAARCPTGTCMPSWPQSANESSGSFIGLTYCKVM